MIKKMVPGFLLAESMVALIVTTLGVMIMALIVGESRTLEHSSEAKTDRAYAWHVMNQNKVKQVLIHDHVYQQINTKEIYDETENKVYQIKN